MAKVICSLAPMLEMLARTGRKCCIRTAFREYNQVIVERLEGRDDQLLVQLRVTPNVVDVIPVRSIEMVESADA